MKALAIVCPTRGRPERCIQMVHSALATSDADVLLYVDRDDPSAPEMARQGSNRVRVTVGEPVGRGHAVNALIDAARDYESYLIVSDDIDFVRPGWDREVAAAFAKWPDGVGVVHLASETGESYVNWACVTRRWIDLLGWFNYPGCGMFCQDTVVQILAEALGRVAFIEPQVVAHDCTVGDRQLEHFAADTSAFLWYCAKHFGADLATLKAAMEPPCPTS